ncbi:hypothetical protein ACJMK2_004333 [Sinanodonta woodiana]|uniref:Uncharacterized protein n=1 Tax=Sinanodonta woodiana TaxID=1069815 RepID=A0ABD3Y2C7_SINWO
MKTGVHILGLALVVCLPSAYTHQETVWLKEVATRFHSVKRTLGNPDLPDHLTFQLRRGSDNFALHLRRNYDINPNADIYVLKQTYDGQSIMKQATNLDREDVAYYQDSCNGAYMTVRCVKRLHQQCERVINGNLNIDDTSYHIQPAKTTDKSAYLIPNYMGKRYILMDQTEFQLEASDDTRDAETVRANDVSVEFKNMFRRFTGLDTRSHVRHKDSRHTPKLPDLDGTDRTRQLKQDYYVNVAVLIDSGVYNLYASRQKTMDPHTKNIAVQKTIREAFSHIMNGSQALFPHKYSKVAAVNGTTYVDAYYYLYDLGEWDNKTSASIPATFDHAMLFTRHSITRTGSLRSIRGKSFMNGVCEATERVSIIQIAHYEQAVRTAAHELGHK